MTDAPVFDPAALISVLQTSHLRFVVIGGIAALLHGSPLPTTDVDITPEASPSNLARLSGALRRLDARIRTEGVPEGRVFDHDATALAAAGMWNLTTAFGDLDISLVPSGTRGYADLARSAVDVDALGVSIPVASLADVIRSKEAANRPKDQRALPVLREILARAEA